MKHLQTTYILIFFALVILTNPLHATEYWPDGSQISLWFKNDQSPQLKNFPKQYIVTDYQITATDSTLLQTERIQALINLASSQGGGLILFPKGTYLSGALFFKPGTHLYLSKDAKLKGSDDIKDFPIKTTRMEGQTLNYFTALINVDHVDGFTLFGDGTIDGNGLRYWRNFWLRRTFNPKCTNMDEMRPRLIYISNSRNVTLSGVHLMNSPFWTSHLYKCEYVKYLRVKITSPSSPVKAPSTDAIDIDACKNILIKECYMSVNDDAIALKGGKGPDADKDSNNGSNENILIEDCDYGFCHGCLTCGSESIHNRNIILRHIKVTKANRLLWLKMRPDTPQHYEYITIEDIQGDVNHMLYIRPWTQFFDLKGKSEIPYSYSNHIVMKNIRIKCDVFFNVEKSDQYFLKDFLFKDIKIEAKESRFDKSLIDNLELVHVCVNANRLD